MELNLIDLGNFKIQIFNTFIVLNNLNHNCRIDGFCILIKKICKIYICYAI